MKSITSTITIGGIPVEFSYRNPSPSDAREFINQIASLAGTNRQTLRRLESKLAINTEVFESQDIS